jgi:hypothetical protein
MEARPGNRKRRERLSLYTQPSPPTLAVLIEFVAEPESYAAAENAPSPVSFSTRHTTEREPPLPPIEAIPEQAPAAPNFRTNSDKSTLFLTHPRLKP